MHLRRRLHKFCKRIFVKSRTVIVLRSQDAAAHRNPFSEPETNQHGTSVSSLIAAVTNNNYGIAGVCWGCRIMCIKVADPDDGRLYQSSFLIAYDYILEKKVKISNHSYGGFGCVLNYSLKSESYVVAANPSQSFEPSKLSWPLAIWRYLHQEIKAAT